MKGSNVVILLIVLAVIFGFIYTASSNDQANQTPATVTRSTAPPVPRAPVSFTSDPAGALVMSGNIRVGRTPVTADLPIGQLAYHVEAEEPYTDYNLYKPFGGTITVPAEGTAVSVWLERTTTTEQQAQIAAAEERRLAAAAAQAQRELEACQRSLGNVSLIIENWGWIIRSGYAISEGRVTNNTNATLRNVRALVEFETSAGTFITSDSALIEYQDLLPDQSSPFTVYTNYNPAMSTGFLAFTEFRGTPIPSRSRDRMQC